MICHNFATELCITKGQEGYVYGWQSTIGSKKQRVLNTLFVKLKNPPSPVQFNGLPGNVVPITASTNMVKAALLKSSNIQNTSRSISKFFYDRFWITRKNMSK